MRIIDGMECIRTSWKLVKFQTINVWPLPLPTFSINKTIVKQLFYIDSLDVDIDEAVRFACVSARNTEVSGERMDTGEEPLDNSDLCVSGGDTCKLIAQRVFFLTSLSLLARKAVVQVHDRIYQWAQRESKKIHPIGSVANAWSCTEVDIFAHHLWMANLRPFGGGWDDTRLLRS